MPIANHLQSGTAVKNIQPVHIPFNSYQPDFTSSDDTDPQSLRSRKYRISRNPSNNPNHVTETDCLLQRNGYSIHLVSSLKQRIKATTLIKQMYASRGYSTESASIFSHNSNEFTFLAMVGEIAAGTLTLRTDSEKGLLADTLYQQEIDNLRKQGKRVCELSKLVLDPQHGLKEMIALLFQISYIYARNFYQATDFFCEVNPRHAIPQKRMFGFQQIGKEKICPRVNAPAVLLHLEHELIEKQMDTLAGSHNESTTTRSLYPHCIPHLEKRQLVNILKADTDKWFCIDNNPQEFLIS